MFMIYEVVLSELLYLSKIKKGRYEINISTIYDRNVYFILIDFNIFIISCHNTILY